MARCCEELAVSDVSPLLCVAVVVITIRNGGMMSRSSRVIKAGRVTRRKAVG